VKELLISPGEKHSALGEREAGAAKHRALEHFQPINGSFDRAGAPSQFAPRTYGVVIVAQTRRKAAEWLEGTGRRLVEPVVERSRIAPPNERCEAVR